MHHICQQHSPYPAVISVHKADTTLAHFRLSSLAQFSSFFPRPGSPSSLTSSLGPFTPAHLQTCLSPTPTSYPHLPHPACLWLLSCVSACVNFLTCPPTRFDVTECVQMGRCRKVHRRSSSTLSRPRSRRPVAYPAVTAHRQGGAADETARRLPGREEPQHESRQTWLLDAYPAVTAHADEIT